MLHQIIKSHTNYDNSIDLAAIIAKHPKLHTVSDVLDHLFYLIIMSAIISYLFLMTL